MFSLERLFGLYLAVATVTWIVVAHQLWSQGRRLAAVLVLCLPAFVYGSWEATLRLPEFARDHVAVGMLPFFPALLLVPLAWLCSIAPTLAEPALADKLLALAAKLMAHATKARALLGFICFAGAIWFLAGLFALQGTASVASLADGSVASGRAALWLSSAVALWPALVLTTLFVLVGVSTSAKAVRRHA